MSRCIIIFITVSLLCARNLELSFEWQKAIASKESKTVLDYYHLLPDIFFDPEDCSEQFTSIASRDSLISVKDLANGYINFNRTSEITLYKDRKNSRDIIAIQIWKSGAGSNVPEGNRLLSFNRATNSWHSEDSLLPKGYSYGEIYVKYNEQDNEYLPYFDLPQTGTSILIRDEESEEILDTLFWNGSSFFVKEN